MTWREVLARAAQQLARAGVDVPEREARWLGEEASGVRGGAFVLQLDQPVAGADVDRLDGMLARRVAGEPLQYVLGRWAFRTLDLTVDRRVLIPRPETEQVVEAALAEIHRLVPSFRARENCGESTSNRRRRANVLDLGCGSGAIGLSIATECDGVDVWCVDASTDAVAVTRQNLAEIGSAAARVTVLQGSWFEPLSAALAGAVDVVVTNPPYVASSDALPAAVSAWEPRLALVAGPTGLEAIEQIVSAAPLWLTPDGVLVSEIGDTQAVAARAIADDAGFRDIEVRPDLAGRDRILIARRA